MTDKAITFECGCGFKFTGTDTYLKNLMDLHARCLAPDPETSEPTEVATSGYTHIVIESPTDSLVVNPADVAGAYLALDIAGGGASVCVDLLVAGSMVRVAVVEGAWDSSPNGRAKGIAARIMGAVARGESVTILESECAAYAPEPPPL